MSTKMTPERAAELVAKHGSIAKAAAAAGIGKTTMRKWYMRSNVVERVPKKPQVAAKPTGKARTLDDFRKQNDQAWKIRDGLKRLFGGGTYMTDAEFREAVGGNPARWRGAADSTEFEDNRFRHKGEMLWASKDTIREMKRVVGVAV